MPSPTGYETKCHQKKFAPSSPLDKYFSVFILDPYRQCLDWPSISFLTSQSIYDTFKSDQMMTEKSEFTTEPSSTKMFDTQCVFYKSSIDIEPLSLTFHALNRHFIHQLPNVKNYSTSHNSDSNQQFSKTKNVP